MDPLQPYAAFVRTFEAGSFSAVAREMGATQSAISKQIAALEASLGVQLFARTTRRIQPTVEGLKLYEHARQLLDAVEGLKAPHDRDAMVSGVLRITAPSSYGRRLVVPKLPRFLAQYPEVRVDLQLSDQIVDLVEEGVELAIRIGNLAPSSLMARPLGTLDYSLVATDTFLSRHGRPSAPSDLTEFPCILFAGGGRWTRWEFESEISGRHAVEVDGPVRVNDPEAMHALVRAHQGVAMLPDWVIGTDLEEHRLEAILPDFYPIPQPINIVYPQTRFLTRRARCFIDFLLADRAHSGKG